MSAITMRPGWLAQAAFVFLLSTSVLQAFPIFGNRSASIARFPRSDATQRRSQRVQTPVSSHLLLFGYPPASTTTRATFLFFCGGIWGVISGIACPSRGHELWGRACFCRENGMKVPTHRLATRPPERSWEGFGKRAEARSRAVRAIKGVLA